MSGEMSCGGGIYNSISVTRPNHHEGQGTQMQPGCCAGFLFISDSLTLSSCLFFLSSQFLFLVFFPLSFLIFFPCLFSSLLSFFRRLLLLCFLSHFFFHSPVFSPSFLLSFMTPTSCSLVSCYIFGQCIA